jgi:hypothetical protein
MTQRYPLARACGNKWRKRLEFTGGTNDGE